MFQVGHIGITTFSKGIPYDAGFCRFWYTPIENILAWPSIDPLTQYLDSEPALKPDCSWYGPIAVPKSRLGYKESQETAKAGTWYKISVEGYYPGESPASRVNLENMPYHRYVAVGKLRAGGAHLLIGSSESWLDFDHEFTSIGKDAAGSKISFTGESYQKALILPSFTPSSYILPPGSSGPEPILSAGGANDVEVIPFFDISDLNIEWNTSLINRFGFFPVIEVWIMQSGTLTYNPTPYITTNANPPAQTSFNISFIQQETGYVIIK